MALRKGEKSRDFSRDPTPCLPTRSGAARVQGKSPQIFPAISVRFVLLSLRCETLKASKPMVPVVHPKRETHEALSIYHTHASHPQSGGHAPLAPGFVPTACTPGPLLRPSRALSACPALPARRHQRDSTQKWLAESFTRPTAASLWHATSALARRLGPGGRLSRTAHLRRPDLAPC